MAAFAILGVCIRRDLEFSFANTDELELTDLQEAADMGAGGGDGECVAAAEAGDRLLNRKGGAKPRPIGFQQVSQRGGLRLGRDDGDQG